ncbi:hypothetical protein GCM10011533_22590 [Streptosporangium jomthongense]|nr:hypothetical protein GCM10011533_22590 [Streptosporangium jomthongense]
MWLRVYARAAAGAFDGGPQPVSNRLVGQFGEGTHVVSMSFEGRNDIKNDDVVWGECEMLLADDGDDASLIKG